MTSSKILEVIQRYRDKFTELGIEKKSHPHETLLRDGEDALAHCYGMLEQMEQFVREGRVEKAFRWLGFIQGVLWMRHIYTLAEIKNHNRPVVDSEDK